MDFKYIGSDSSWFIDKFCLNIFKFIINCFKIIFAEFNGFDYFEMIIVEFF
ncbi:orphan [Acanthamoeba polyphaga mimivirus]|nr:orphan [Mimivirus reunion]WMV62276.1 orphan [Mimivirus sp.]WMV63253.1 orphan [Acanthamoeba polyphaga mimivirus]WMV64230.1 orphan [Mimivirus sp.]